MWMAEPPSEHVYRSYLGWFASRREVERLLHLRLDAFLSQCLLVFLAKEWILEPIRNSGAPLGHVDSAFIGILLARHAGLVLAMVVGAIPTDQSQRFLADSKMRMKPVTAIRCGGDHADRLIVLAVDIFRLAVLPWRHPVASRPSVGVALALEADENRRGHMRVSL